MILAEVQLVHSGRLGWGDDLRGRGVLGRVDGEERHHRPFREGAYGDGTHRRASVGRGVEWARRMGVAGCRRWAGCREDGTQFDRNAPQSTSSGDAASWRGSFVDVPAVVEGKVRGDILV